MGQSVEKIGGIARMHMGLIECLLLNGVIVPRNFHSLVSA